MTGDFIRLRGCRVHNLKNVDVDIPRESLVAVCGVSGAGKTSLVVDTLYAEGQRRYIESFSTYTRQFLERFDKPEYDSIDGLPPALALRRSSSAHGNRSTVGTASETLEYLRLLFAKISRPFCTQCDQPVVKHDPAAVATQLEKLDGRRVMITFQATWQNVEQRAIVLADLQADGLLRIIAGDQEVNLADADRKALAKSLPRSGSVSVVVDRVKGGSGSRATESLETAFEFGGGEIALLVSADNPEDDLPDIDTATAACTIGNRNWLRLSFSNRLSCADCDIEYPEPQPRLFSFNNPLGACPECEGFGDTIDLDLELVIPDRRKTLAEGAIAPWSTPAYGNYLDELTDIAAEVGLPLDVPVSKLTKAQMAIVVDGHEPLGFPGLNGFFQWLERKKYKMHVRVFLSRWRSYNTCHRCEGKRLSDGALAYRIDDRNIADLCAMQIVELRQFLVSLEINDRDREIANNPLSSAITRLEYLDDVGLGYLTLDRRLRTLSGGEAQRTALAALLGSSLVNMLYILDEPSVGLHPEDVHRLGNAIGALANRGNTVVMIEHDPTLIKSSDWLIELGPAAGSRGGEVAFSGKLNTAKSGQSATADFVLGRKNVRGRRSRRQPKKWIKLRGCTGNNLKGFDVDFPAGVLCCVTGVSGSGKSSLVHQTLFHAVDASLTGRTKKGLPYRSLALGRVVDECIMVAQSSASKSKRSNAATTVKAMDELRSVFAATVAAKTQNFSAGHFSFNSPKGRCEHCSGDGVLQIDMQFLADVQMACPECDGTRYKSEILRVKYRDRSIADVLAMTVDEALDFFRGEAAVKAKLQVLADAGLGYIQLGQPTSMMSEGENQRLKLAAHLAAQSRKRCLFILDEPSTGLHPSDLVQLLACFDVLIDQGHSIVIVEHNTHLVAAADYIVDLGPGPADRGGAIVATGTPEEIVANPDSITGKHLSLD
ncbi:MAG: excinuclease ABC subunit UvrA [Aureliella sp.]